MESLHKILNPILEIWRFEIISTTGVPITVGNLATAGLLFVIGIYISKFLSRQIRRRVLARLGLHTGAAAALQKLFFYIFALFFTLFALNFSNIPLTIFTVIGGALALGIGFGSQNIVNNFISGLILLVERPIRVGDIIEVGGLYGAVEHIGARSTLVRSISNVDIIVPNSTFLEQNVMNWTLSSNVIRTSVKVGVVYGAPTRDVERIVLQVATDHEKVLKTPEPVILFQEFGDNSLNFEIFFWVRMKILMDVRKVESDIRYKIDDEFRKANIVIAFPQRDVHLDTQSPLEVRVLSNK